MQAPSETSRVARDCATCRKNHAVCVCDLQTTSHVTHARVLILQHPQEQDFVLGTAPLLEKGLKNAHRVVGMSWRSFSHAMGREVQPSRWCVLYPSSLKRDLTPRELAASHVFLDSAGREMTSTHGIDGVVVLDGTWSQAKTLWWRNPWLLKLNRLLVQPKEPSIYGKLRREPKRTHVSTLESVALALTALGEDELIQRDLCRAFRTMVQRVRDANRRPAKRA